MARHYEISGSRLNSTRERIKQATCALAAVLEAWHLYVSHTEWMATQLTRTDYSPV